MGDLVGRRKADLPWAEKRFDRFSFESQFPPFVDQAASLDDSATRGELEFLFFPPNSSDRHHCVEFSLIPKSKGSAKFSWAAQPLSPF